MADAAFNSEIRSPRAARALALATAFFFCSLTAGALVITVMGKGYRPEVVLDLAAAAGSKNRRAANRFCRGDAAARGD